MRTGSCCDLTCRPARQRDALSAGAAVRCSSGEVFCGRRGCVQPWNMPQGVDFVRECAQGQDMTSTPNDGANNDGQLDSHGSDFKRQKEKMRFGVMSLHAHHNGPPLPPPPPIATPDPNDDPHDVPPTGCLEWYDGCNNCHILAETIWELQVCILVWCCPCFQCLGILSKKDGFIQKNTVLDLL